MALCLRYLRCLKTKIETKTRYDLRRNSKCPREVKVKPISVELRQAEFMILKEVQREAGLDTSGASPIAKIDPYNDVSGIIRVGGRLQLSNLTGQCIHPAILPRKSHFTNLLGKHYHERVYHQGKGITKNEIRANGYWILDVSSASLELLVSV